MNKVRILVKKTHQPPIDTPASITHKTIDVECEELHNLLANNEKEYSDKEYKHSTFEVIGAEPIFQEETDEH